MSGATENGSSLGLLARLDPNAYANYAAFKAAVEANATNIITPIPSENWSGGFGGSNVGFATINGAKCFVDPDYDVYGELFFAETRDIWLRVVVALPADAFDGIDLETGVDSILAPFLRCAGVLSAKADDASYTKRTGPVGTPDLRFVGSDKVWYPSAFGQTGERSDPISTPEVEALAGTLVDIRVRATVTVDGDDIVTSYSSKYYVNSVLLFEELTSDPELLATIASGNPGEGGWGECSFAFHVDAVTGAGVARIEVYDAAANDDPWSGGDALPAAAPRAPRNSVGVRFGIGL